MYDYLKLGEILTNNVRWSCIHISFFGGCSNLFFFKIEAGKITRGHNFTVVKEQSRLDVRKFSFPQRTINVWNKLYWNGQLVWTPALGVYL